MPSKFKAGHDARIRGEDRRQGNEWNLMGLLSVELNISICKTFFLKNYTKLFTTSQLVRLASHVRSDSQITVKR